MIGKLRRGILYGIIALGVIWAGLFLILAPALPDTSDLRRMRKTPGVTIVAADGSVLEQRGAFNGSFVGLRTLPSFLPQAVIATEDRRFYDHFGMDVIGFGRAIWANIRAGRIVQGGSTITQQLAKNLYLSPERTILRKLRELMLAIWLESRMSKDEILALYLNRVYLGAGTYGVEAAARKYFGKPARTIGLSEAAMLTGLLKAPTRYAPTNDLRRSRARAGQVLENMVAAGYLSRERADAARRAPATPVVDRPGPRRARYFVDWVLDHLPDWAGHIQDDLVVFTTLDPTLQGHAERSVRNELRRSGGSRKAGQAALVAFDRYGAVRAMVGGRSYAKSQFNRAVQARRQPGSAFKPFVYLAAMEHGLSPDSVITDAPVTIDGWQPQNHGGRYRGAVTLKRALADSINTVAVKLSERVGRDAVIEAAQRLGIGAEIRPHPSLALGTTELSLFDLTAAYLPFANGGRAVAPFAVAQIRTRDGRSVFHRQRWVADRVIEPGHARQMTEMMSEVLISGTGRQARLDGYAAAGKTGTTQDYRDGWFIGYTPTLVTGVWLGNDDNAPMRRVTGGQLPARMWRRFMTRAVRHTPPEPSEDGFGDEIAGPVEMFDRVVAWIRRFSGDSADEKSDRFEQERRRVARQIDNWLRQNTGRTGGIESLPPETPETGDEAE